MHRLVTYCIWHSNIPWLLMLIHIHKLPYPDSQDLCLMFEVLQFASASFVSSPQHLGLKVFAAVSEHESNS